MRNIVYTTTPTINTIQVRQGQLPAKLQRQTIRTLTHAHPLLGRAIQRGQKFQFTTTPQATLTIPNDKYVSKIIHFLHTVENSFC